MNEHEARALAEARRKSAGVLALMTPTARMPGLRVAIEGAILVALEEERAEVARLIRDVLANAPDSASATERVRRLAADLVNE